MRTVRCSDRWGGGGVCPGGCLPGGVCLPGGCLSRRVSARGCLPRGVYPSMHWGRHPLPPVNRILDTHLWKYYLATTSLQTVIMIVFCYFECLLHQTDTVVERQKIGPQTAVLYVLALPLLDTLQWLWSYERFIEHVHFCWRMLRWLCFDWEKKMYCKIE